MDPRTVVIRLELEPSGDLLTGRASDDHQSREFSGWMGLVAAIDSLVDGGPRLPAEGLGERRPGR